MGYAQSKVANILFTVSLADKLKSKGILAFSVHPGSVGTNLSKYITEELRNEALQTMMKKTDGQFKYFRKTIQSGCSTTLVAALDPSLADQSGAYLEDAKISEIPAEDYATDPKNAERLWELSEKLVGQKFDI